MNLHTGKLDNRIETSVTEAFADALAACAHTLSIIKADLVRDMIYLGFAGETYSLHLAKDKDASTKALLATMRESFGNDAGRP
jgi:hypothetical protein